MGWKLIHRLLLLKEPGESYSSKRWEGGARCKIISVYLETGRSHEESDPDKANVIPVAELLGHMLGCYREILDFRPGMGTSPFSDYRTPAGIHLLRTSYFFDHLYNMHSARGF